ncbi:MAG: DNA-formamidopyrimidine glycosylase family protein [Polyangiales bacterium]|nr:formamidopyrimidine-DNA glycosylase [Sandaracinaceae bacterium]
MPELPDIESYCHALRARVVGQPLEGFELLSPFVLRTVSPAPASVVGSRLLSVSRLGKRIVFSFEHDVHAVVHLMIAGRFRFEAATGKPPKPLSPRAGPLLRMTFPTGLLTLTEVSKRKRAKLHMVQGAVALAEHDPGGIEPLEVDAAAFRTALTAENHTIKRALTDPRVLSGIGNAYSDEILHRAELSPVRWTTRLSDDDFARLYAATRAVLTEFRDRMIAELDGGFPEKVTAFRPDMAVHGKYGQPCPVCSDPVQRIRYADNETNYCARCQNDGVLLADRSLSRLLKGDWPKTLDALEELKRARQR